MNYSYLASEKFVDCSCMMVEYWKVFQNLSDVFCSFLKKNDPFTECSVYRSLTQCPCVIIRKVCVM